jgi:hypothetical protein
MRAAARLAAALALVTVPILPGQAPAATSTRAEIPLPAPVHNVDPLANVNLNLRKDRLLKSVVPGPVNNTEHLTAELGPTGAPAVVQDVQELVITKPGPYIVRELGPARAAVSLNDTNPPVLELGQVVWQGFSPGRRDLQAQLTLDAGLEAHRLPMSATFTFRDRHGKPGLLKPGGVAPADGTVTMTLNNQTALPTLVPTGTADVGPLAANLDLLLAAGNQPRLAVPPYAGGRLPLAIPGHVTGQAQVNAVSALRVTGTIGVVGATADTVQGPGTTPATGGASIAGTLNAQVTLTVGMRSGQRLALDLQVLPWLDPRTLLPPAPAATWKQWAAGRPAASDVTAATNTLIGAAAVTARSAEYSPYLQADTPGPDLSTFHYVMAAETATRRAGVAINAKPGAITATFTALLAIAGNAALLRRRL